MSSREGRTYSPPDKLGEEYAYTFVRQELLGSHNVYIGDGQPGGRIYGVSLGTPQDP